VTDRVPVGVLASGGGTNLGALIDAAADPEYPARIAVVISNRREAGALDRARAAGIPAVWIPHRDKERADFDAELVAALLEHGCTWVALAGFMRILTPSFLGAFPERVLNIHPALLPAFPGVHAQRQAHEAGVQITGATVHLVDAGTDTGPIIAQGGVPVLPSDTVDVLQQRILIAEHRLYPMVLRWAAEGRIAVDGTAVCVTLPEGESRWIWVG
jgi:phosphoribosylglycinamide formyltransferase-1